MFSNNVSQISLMNRPTAASLSESQAKNEFRILDLDDERTTLPYLRPPNTKFSIFQLLKDLIGKDLTKVSMPVYLNEPMSITQKAADSNEYIYLLERAAKEPNPFKRMAIVAAFNGTVYNTIKDRSMKPFNPLLGETFELVTADFKFISEQVSHHPPITAYHTESQYYE
jgi:hypothetical protein